MALGKFKKLNLISGSTIVIHAYLTIPLSGDSNLVSLSVYIFNKEQCFYI